MRGVRLLCGGVGLLVVGTCGFAGPAAGWAEEHHPADYPLRVHVFEADKGGPARTLDKPDGKDRGRANLFEHGQATGIDFLSACKGHLETSTEYGTYPAKWRRQGAELVVLLPELGNPGQYRACEFRVQEKDYAYVRRGGRLETEPVAEMQQWMTAHGYDPEHGKDAPLFGNPHGGGESVPSAQGSGSGAVAPVPSAASSARTAPGATGTTTAPANPLTPEAPGTAPTGPTTPAAPTDPTAPTTATPH